MTRLCKHHRLNLGIMGLIVALGFLCYANTLTGPFLFDDYDNILLNGYLRLHNLAPGSLLDAAFKSPLPSRPVANLSFALNYLVHGYWLPGYHLTNIAIHCLTGLFLFLVLKLTFATPALRESHPPEQALPLAGLASLLWLLNPADTQSVSYLVQRMNSLSAMFFLLSMLLYLKARTSGKQRLAYAAGCLVAFLLALGAKEIAATLPPLLFLYEWYFFRDLDRGWLKRQLPWLGLALAALIAFGCLSPGRNFSSMLSGYQSRDFTLLQRLLTEPRVVCRYLLLAFLPYPGLLNLDHDYPISTGLLQPPTTALAIVVLAGLFLAAVLSARRQRLLSFAILWFFLNLAIESSFVPLEIIFDHRTYLPSMLVWPPLLALAWRLPEGQRRIALGGALLLLAVFATWTVQRNQVWADEVALNRDIAAKSPDKGRVHANLGRALLGAGQEEEGLRELNRALALAPEHPVIYLNFGYYYLERQRYPEAIANFRKVIELSPRNSSVYNYIAQAYCGNRQYPEAIAAARAAVTDPAFREEALLTLGIASSESGDLQTAVSSFRELAGENPGNGRYRFNLGRAQEKAGQKGVALRSYEEALAISPESDKNIIRQAIGRLRND